MATFGQVIRRGLPRVRGGEPWPAAGAVPNGAAVGDAGSGDGGSGDATTAGVAAASAGVTADSVGVPVTGSVAPGAGDAGPNVAGGASSAGEAGPGAAAGAGDAGQDAAGGALRGAAAPGAAGAAEVAASAGTPRRVRRGLPRIRGGEPWPPESVVPPRQIAGAADVDPQVAAGERGADAAAVVPPRQIAGAAGGDAQVAAGEQAAADQGAGEQTAGVQAAGAAALLPPRQIAGAAGGDAQVAAGEQPAGAQGAGERMLRRGLPRVSGGDPWPPAGIAPVRGVTAAGIGVTAADAVPAGVTHEPEDHTLAPAAASAPGVPALAPATPSSATPSAVVPAPAPAPATSSAADISAPLPFTRTVWEGRYARTRPAPAPEPTRVGPFTRLQWLGVVVIGGGGLLFAAAMAVFAVRWLISTDPFQDFLTAFPGEYHLPAGAPVGFPAWLGWQHFFNVFLMVLIIRSGLQVRTEKRPSAFWSRRGSKRKISLNLWFHQSLDILWLVNGVAFVVLLFVTGQWMRIVPTSWEVFPNAVSAALQYVSLDWPTENGWVNYNALQQLAYFATVFIAAPLAAITGVRMSGIWPKNATALNKAYPVEWARAVHFPVMLYFVLFIFVHVVLVFATGALRNLNHMYAAQGSVDPDAYAMNWTGFWIFSLSILVIAGAWAAARPLVLAPIAKLFGNVSSR